MSSEKKVSKMAKKALVFLAPGTEEMEFTISVDVLRRAGIQTIVCGVEDNQTVKCSRDVRIVPDVHINDIEALYPLDILVLPGGLGGSKAMSDSFLVGKALREHATIGGYIAAICAAPLALKAHKVYYGKSLTSYPSVKESLLDGEHYQYRTDNVVVDGPLITSRGPGTAFLFALTIVSTLLGKEKATEVAKAMLLDF